MKSDTCKFSQYNKVATLFLYFLFCITSSCSGEDDFMDGMTEFYDETEVTKSDLMNNSDTLTIAHWNIGHFSLGKSSETLIEAGNAIEMVQKYHQMLDTLNVDVIGICEYNPTFDKSGSDTKTLLFCDYPFYYIGKKYSYNCNAIFSKYLMTTMVHYDFSQFVQKRYWIDSVVLYNETPIHIIETHLDWNQDANGALYRQRQMQELASALQKEDYVIICGDFNSRNASEYECFLRGGFSFANDWIMQKEENLVTIDNIIVKGFEVLSCIVVKNQNLSDHPLLKTVLHILKKEN